MLMANEELYRQEDPVCPASQCLCCTTLHPVRSPAGSDNPDTKGFCEPGCYLVLLATLYRRRLSTRRYCTAGLTIMLDSTASFLEGELASLTIHCQSETCPTYRVAREAPGPLFSRSQASTYHNSILPLIISVVARRSSQKTEHDHLFLARGTGKHGYGYGTTQCTWFTWNVPSPG